MKLMKTLCTTSTLILSMVGMAHAADNNVSADAKVEANVNTQGISDAVTGSISATKAVTTEAGAAVKANASAGVDKAASASADAQAAASGKVDAGKEKASTTMDGMKNRGAVASAEASGKVENAMSAKTEATASVTATSEDKALIRNYFSANTKATSRIGSAVSGLMGGSKKAAAEKVAVGSQLSAEARSNAQALPKEASGKLSSQAQGYTFLRMDNQIVQIDSETNVVVDTFLVK